MNGQAQQPLAWSQTGDPIELPAPAVQWRVRRLQGGKGGAPEIVYGADGLPLTVDIGVSPEDFAEAVDRRAGKYRLDALDEAKKPIAGVPPAYVMVGGPNARSDVPQGEPNDIAVRTLSEALTRQTSQIATLVDACARLVAAVDSAGVSRRPPPPLVATVEAKEDDKRRNGRDDDEEEDDDEDVEEPKSFVDQAAELYEKLGADGIMAYANAVPHVVGGVLEKVKAAVGGGDAGGKS